MISRDLVKKYLLDEDINKYIVYYLLIFTPIVYYLVINLSLSLAVTEIHTDITHYIVFITILTLLSEVSNIQYKLFIRFITTIIIFISLPLMMIISFTGTLLVILISTIYVSNIIVFTITIYKMNFNSKIKYIYGEIKKHLYNIIKTCIHKISKYKVLILIIIVFLTPLLLPGFGETNIKPPDAQANVSYAQFSHNNSTEYGVAISVNNMENSDYLIIKERKASSKTIVSRCTNNEPKDVDYAPDTSNKSGVITQNTHSKYAGIILSQCDIALVKGLDLGDIVHVYGDRNGRINLIDKYKVKSVQQ